MSLLICCDWAIVEESSASTGKSGGTQLNLAHLGKGGKPGKLSALPEGFTIQFNPKSSVPAAGGQIAQAPVLSRQTSNSSMLFGQNPKSVFKKAVDPQDRTNNDMTSDSRDNTFLSESAPLKLSSPKSGETNKDSQMQARRDASQPQESNNVGTSSENVIGRNESVTRLENAIKSAFPQEASKSSPGLVGKALSWLSPQEVADQKIIPATAKAIEYYVKVADGNIAQAWNMMIDDYMEYKKQKQSSQFDSSQDMLDLQKKLVLFEDQTVNGQYEPGVLSGMNQLRIKDAQENFQMSDLDSFAKSKISVVSKMDDIKTQQDVEYRNTMRDFAQSISKYIEQHPDFTKVENEIKGINTKITRKIDISQEELVALKAFEKMTLDGDELSNSSASANIKTSGARLSKDQAIIKSAQESLTPEEIEVQRLERKRVIEDSLYTDFLSHKIDDPITQALELLKKDLTSSQSSDYKLALISVENILDNNNGVTDIIRQLSGLSVRNLEIRSQIDLYLTIITDLDFKVNNYRKIKDKLDIMYLDSNATVEQKLQAVTKELEILPKNHIEQRAVLSDLRNTFQGKIDEKSGMNTKVDNKVIELKNTYQLYDKDNHKMVESLGKLLEGVLVDVGKEIYNPKSTDNQKLLITDEKSLLNISQGGINTNFKLSFQKLKNSHSYTVDNIDSTLNFLVTGLNSIAELVDTDSVFKESVGSATIRSYSKAIEKVKPWMQRKLENKKIADQMVEDVNDQKLSSIDLENKINAIDSVITQLGENKLTLLSQLTDEQKVLCKDFNTKDGNNLLEVLEADRKGANVQDLIDALYEMHNDVMNLKKAAVKEEAKQSRVKFNKALFEKDWFAMAEHLMPAAGQTVGEVQEMLTTAIQKTLGPIWELIPVRYQVAIGTYISMLAIGFTAIQSDQRLTQEQKSKLRWQLMTVGLQEIQKKIIEGLTGVNAEVFKSGNASDILTNAALNKTVDILVPGMQSAASQNNGQNELDEFMQQLQSEYGVSIEGQNGRYSTTSSMNVNRYSPSSSSFASSRSVSPSKSTGISFGSQSSLNSSPSKYSSASTSSMRAKPKSPISSGLNISSSAGSDWSSDMFLYD